VISFTFFTTTSVLFFAFTWGVCFVAYVYIESRLDIYEYTLH
jgi:hypothetical protein